MTSLGSSRQVVNIQRDPPMRYNSLAPRPPSCTNPCGKCGLLSKKKIFAWLLMQNRIWTADRFQKRGSPNCGFCPLRKQTTKSACHLFVHCRFTRRIWQEIKNWTGIASLHPSQWSGITMDHWWRIMTNGGSNRKGIASLT
jgi:hypothetical protein